MERNKTSERLGMRKINSQGLVAEIVDYVASNEIFVRFDDGTLIKTRWDHFIKGLFRNPNVPFDKSLRKEREGKETINHQGCQMKIVQYHNTKNVIVQFNNNPNQTVKTSYDNFIKGKTENPFIPTRYGIGITGIRNIYKEKEYQTWYGMIQRCYSQNRKNRRWEGYTNCTVNEKFLHYSDFYNWIIKQENYEVWKNNEHFHLDKDILCKGNKEYSPEKCCLVPSNVNNLIKGSGKSHKYMGVSQIRLSGKYSAICQDGYLHRKVYIGTFNTEYEAFLAYKKYKENVIKQVAEREYANRTISKQCRDALMQYKIEETD